MSDERRREPRLAITVPVTWRLVRLERVEEGHEGTMVDVSANGCCVEPRELAGGVGLGAVVEIEVMTDAGVATRRGLVVADPTRDRRLHLALRGAGDEHDLVALLT